MAKERFPEAALYVFVLSLIINLLLLTPVIQADEPERKAYIVYMGDRAIGDISVGDIYLKMMKEVLGSDLRHLKDAAEYLLYTFKNFQGYVALLTDEEADMISKMVGVVSVFPNRKHRLHTTRSWDFMGFPSDVERSSVESDIIIGVIDSGIWPESESFTDEGFSPPPAKWKGRCETALNFTCNNKIIGAQYFRADGNITTDDVASPRDLDGHGTHTASTAGGGIVNGASFLGLGEGTARGGVPSARISVYKVCWSDGCYGADIMAAFDAAISDGVDIISLSVGGDIQPYFKDAIDIGAFHAMQRGILTSASAGNDGPELVTVANFAPWYLTVAASSIDRKFITEVKLDNGLVVQGISLNTFDPQNMTFPLVYGRTCGPELLIGTSVEGKIVVCSERSRGSERNRGEEAFLAGAAGMITQGLELQDVASPFPLPASYLMVADGKTVLSYVRNSTSIQGAILKSVAIEDLSAPIVASFSSRGPNPYSPGILKPDLTAPGVNILAAFSPTGTVSGFEGDLRSVQYNILSGTSMACPHATAVAAYVKSFHPTWSPAAIKSALMTSAFPVSSALHEEAEFAYGSGQINPLKAVNPGLVYDAGKEDYIKFLCSEGLTETQIGIISRTDVNCSSSDWDLNYPSIALHATVGAFDTVFKRIVTNVGSPNSTYSFSTTAPEVLEIDVQPSVLSFDSLGQKLTFTVRLSGAISSNTLISADLLWDDGEHQVRSPIAVYNLF